MISHGLEHLHRPSRVTPQTEQKTDEREGGGRAAKLPAVYTNASIAWSKSEFNPNHHPQPPQVAFLVVFCQMLKEISTAMSVLLEKASKCIYKQKKSYNQISTQQQNKYLIVNLLMITSHQQ